MSETTITILTQQQLSHVFGGSVSQLPGFSPIPMPAPMPGPVIVPENNEDDTVFVDL